MNRRRILHRAVMVLGALGNATEPWSRATAGPNDDFDVYNPHHVWRRAPSGGYKLLEIFWVAALALTAVGCEDSGSPGDESEGDGGGRPMADAGDGEGMEPVSNLCAAESGCGGDPAGSWLEGPGCTVFRIEATIDFNECPAVESMAQVDMLQGGALVLDVDGTVDGMISVDVNTTSLYEITCLGSCDWPDCEPAGEAHCRCFDTLPIATLGAAGDGAWDTEDGILRVGEGVLAQSAPYCVTEDGLALDLNIGGAPIRIQLQRGATTREFGVQPVVVHLGAGAGPVSIVSGGQQIAEGVEFGQVGVAAPVSVGDVIVGVRGEDIALDAPEPVRAGRNSRAIFFLWGAGETLRLDGGIGGPRLGMGILHALEDAGPVRFTAFSDDTNSTPVTGRLEPGEKMLFDPAKQMGYLAIDIGDDGREEAVFDLRSSLGAMAFARKPDGGVGLLDASGREIDWRQVDSRETFARITNLRDGPLTARVGDAELEVMPGSTGTVTGLRIGTVAISIRAGDGQWEPAAEQPVGIYGLEVVFYGDESALVARGNLNVFHLGGGLGPVDVLTSAYTEALATALQPDTVVDFLIYPRTFRGIVPVTRVVPDLVAYFPTGDDLAAVYLMAAADGRPRVWTRDRDDEAVLVEVDPRMVPRPSVRVLVSRDVEDDAISVSVDERSLGAIPTGSISQLVSVPFGRFRIEATIDGQTRERNTSSRATGIEINHISDGSIRFGLVVPFAGDPQLRTRFIGVSAAGWQISGDGCVADLEDLHLEDGTYLGDPRDLPQIDLCHDRDGDGAPDLRYPIFADGIPRQPVGLLAMPGIEPSPADIWVITADEALLVEAIDLPLQE